MSWLLCTFGALAAAATTQAGATPSASEPHPILELRQYKLVKGAGAPFVQLFDREFVETQEAEGMKLIGQFRDRTDPDRFVWIRAFPDMDVRQRALTSFYTGPTWKAHRGTANPMMIDSTNVILLKDAWVGSGFGQMPTRAAVGEARPARIAVVTIHYLWLPPNEGFTSFFKDKLEPALERAGLHVDAALVREESENNFPRLPVRESEKLFVWVARADGEAALAIALSRLESDRQWPSIKSTLFDLEERPSQRLLLDPTPRSGFR